MYDIIRVATSEEIEKIAEKSDLSTATSVVTFGGKDFAVLRNCFELDPIFFAEDSTDRRKMLFTMNLETALRLQGIKEIYFNVQVSNEAFRKVVETSGATPTSLEPEIRYKKVL